MKSSPAQFETFLCLPQNTNEDMEDGPIIPPLAVMTARTGVKKV